MKNSLYLFLLTALVLSSCGETPPSFQDKIEQAVTTEFPEETVENVQLIDTIYTAELEALKVATEAVILQNVNLQEEMHLAQEHVFDLSLDIEFAAENEKERLTQEMQVEELRIDNYLAVADELDSLAANSQLELDFTNEILSTHTVAEGVAYYHVSARISGKKRYCAIAPVASDLYLILAVSSQPILGL